MDEITTPGILISSSRPSDGEKIICGGSTEMSMVFTLEAFHTVFLVHSFDNFRSFFLQTAVQEPIPLILILIKISLKFDLFLFFLIPRFPLVQERKEINETLICDGCGASDPKCIPRRRMWARKNLGTVWF